MVQLIHPSPGEETALKLLNDYVAEQKTALGNLYGDFRGSLMQFAGRFLRSPQDIEDVVQEAFVKVLEAQQQSAPSVNNATVWSNRSIFFCEMLL